MMKPMQKLLESFLAPTEEAVMTKFLKLPNARRDTGKGQPEWVYIPGKRSDRVLCVAHADTVHDDKTINDLIWIGDVCCRSGGVAGGGWSEKKDTGPLGADDRAGCAMMYDLWDGSHSLLVTTGEERGLVGARAAVKDLRAELTKHQFAVQVDRRGDRQAVFYDIGTERFKNFITDKLTEFDYEKQPWKEWQGSSTDIRHICNEIHICGVNLSAGFWNEHSEGELLLLGAWLHTRTVLRRLLKMDKLESFKFQHKTYGSTYNAGGVNYYDGGGRRGFSFGSAGYVSEIELLIKKIEDKELSGKQRKKLAKVVRKMVQKDALPRWQAVRLLDKLYPTELATERNEQIALLPASTPMADSWVKKDDDPPMCYCGVKESDMPVLHKTWCHRWAARRRQIESDIGRVRKCVHGKDLSGTCEECEKGTPAPCEGCGALYVHKMGCKLESKGNCLTKQGEIAMADQQACSECHRAKGHSIMCSRWVREHEMIGSAAGDSFCSECYFNLTAEGRHSDSCSLATHSKVRVKPKALSPAVHQKVDPIEVTVCHHVCVECGNGNSKWSHSRLPINQTSRHSKGCLIVYEAPCSHHSQATYQLVSWYEAKLKEALEAARGKERKALPPAVIADPHDVSAQLDEAGSWD